MEDVIYQETKKEVWGEDYRFKMSRSLLTCVDNILVFSTISLSNNIGHHHCILGIIETMGVDEFIQGKGYSLSIRQTRVYI